MPKRDFWKIVFTSSIISSGIILFLLNWPIPISTQAKPARPISEPLDRLLTEDETINIQVYEMLSKGVVNVTSTTLEYTWFFEVVPREGVGSGIIIDKKGHIVTNHHVIKNSSGLEVTLYDKSKHKAKIVGIDARNDIAILRIDCPEEILFPIRQGQSQDLKVGQKVLAIGNPFGLERTLTTGIISSLGRKLKTDHGLIDQMIQTDAAINPGNSGGPLLNTSAQLIGINTAIYSRTGQSAGIGFAIPVNTLSRILPDLLKHGRVLRPWFGVRGRSLTPTLSDLLKLDPKNGFLVEQVEENSSAYKAGIKGGNRRVLYGNTSLIIGGDVITSLAGKPITSGDDLDLILEDKRPGEKIEIIFHREGNSIKNTIQLIKQTSEQTFRF